MTEVRDDALSQAIDAHLAQVLAGYRSAVPDIDTGPIQIFGRLGAIARLYGLFTERFLVDRGVTHPQYQVLGLIRAGIASTPAELAFYLRWESDEAAAVVQSLECAELIGQAVPEEGDSPKLLLTSQGTQLADDALRVFSKAQAQALEGLGDTELRHLQDALDELIARLAFLYPG